MVQSRLSYTPIQGGLGSAFDGLHKLIGQSAPDLAAGDFRFHHTAYYSAGETGSLKIISKGCYGAFRNNLLSDAPFLYFCFTVTITKQELLVFCFSESVSK